MAYLIDGLIRTTDGHKERNINGEGADTNSLKVCDEYLDGEPVRRDGWSY
jgi:hypothetical protein